MTAAEAEDLAFAGVAALGRRLRERAISPAAVAEAFLARLDALAPAAGCLASVAAVAAERARAAARTLDDEAAQGRWRGPLHAVPALLAECIDAHGVATGLGLPDLPGSPGRDAAAQDATLAARLADQGAVLLGKVRIAPLAGALPPGGGPPCRSPWEPGRAVGGPSPGAAAAVAAGLASFALAVEGTEGDAGAAGCGVTALRPTYGVLSRAGVTGPSYTLAAVSIVARSAEDAALVLDAAAGADGRDPSSIGAPAGLARVGPELPRGLRVGVLAGGDPAGREAVRAVEEALRGAGAIVAPAALPPLPWAPLAAVLGGAEAEAIRAALAPAAPPAGGPAAAASAADYVRAARLRGEAQRALARLLSAHDLLLAPAPAGAGEAGDALAAAVALGGLPAVTFPAAFAGGRPAAARVVAPPLEDARALSAVALFQARSSHHLQRPPGAALAAAVTRR